jgi:hypothetical protein
MAAKKSTSKKAQGHKKGGSKKGQASAKLKHKSTAPKRTATKTRRPVAKAASKSGAARPKSKAGSAKSMPTSGAAKASAKQASTPAATQPLSQSNAKNGLLVKAYRGDGSAMIAFDLDQQLTQNLAGFAIQRTDPNGTSAFLPNRLSFDTKVTSKTTPQTRVWTPSDQAPFQKFRWLDFPPDLKPGTYTYEVIPMYFDTGGQLKKGQSADVSINLGAVAPKFTSFQLGFTRGYLSSQAYAAKFNNADIRPPLPKTIDYPTDKFAPQYQWLGFDARKLVFDFLQECIADKSITVDLFAYDLDEPDFIRGLQQLGPRLRAYLDNAPLHTKAGAMEIQAHQLLVKSAGAANVKQGHFQRFAHCKVLIQKKNGKPVKVLTGSANFSVRGLYVQANNVLVFDDETTAQLYESAFEQSFDDAAQFSSSEIADGWHDVSLPTLPPFSVCFSPHKTADVSLAKVGSAIQNATSSVLFAVMELGGGGPVLTQLTQLASRNLFSYGMTQSLTGGIKVLKPGDANGIIVPFAFLKKQVPPPFAAEVDGGMGQVIHHKFVVVDFNGADPVVFAGSSNLASGGEQANGDNLLAITDPEVATAYAIEAIRLVDHYHFRAAMQTATSAAPMTLQTGGAASKWWQPYYDPKDMHSRERLLFSR